MQRARASANCEIAEWTDACQHIPSIRAAISLSYSAINDGYHKVGPSAVVRPVFSMAPSRRLTKVASERLRALATPCS